MIKLIREKDSLFMHFHHLIINRKSSANFFYHFLMILFLHLFFLAFPKIDFQTSNSLKEINKVHPLTIRRLKSNEVKNSKIKTKNSFINPFLPQKSQKSWKQLSDSPGIKKDKISFNQLSEDLSQDFNPQHFKDQKKFFTKRKKTSAQSSGLSLKTMNEFDLKKIKQSFSQSGTKDIDLEMSKLIEKTHHLKDAVVSIEVPDGVKFDQLNEYELKFYGFQRRVALRYINSILENITKFQKQNSHFRFSSNDRIIMTARITYDQEGNVTQIKMIKWTQIDKIQNLFENIVKGIDQLQNPPQELWEGKNEFSMFYTLDIIQ